MIDDTIKMTKGARSVSELRRNSKILESTYGQKSSLIIPLKTERCLNKQAKIPVSKRDLRKSYDAAALSERLL